MKIRYKKLSCFLLVLSYGLALATVSAQAQLNEHCTVSILNRNAPVRRDGSWDLPNVPSGFGPVRARATCVENGVTRSGESAPFTIAAGRMNAIPQITLGSVTPIPRLLTLTSAAPTLTSIGQTTALSTIATYPDNATRNVTPSSSGTVYRSSNSAIVAVTSEGLLTAVASGTVVLQAANNGASGIIRVSVVLSNADTDGDGIPDSVELSLGLDPRNPVDALEDFDRDNLTNLREYQLGTDMRNRDSDGDGLADGVEVDVYHTDSLLADSDGDRIPDGVEVQTGSNPSDPNSYDLRRAVGNSVIQPSPFLLVTNVIFPNVSQLLTWRVTLIDGKTTLDIASDLRTNYQSSNLNTCNFGSERGRIFAGQPGSCTITLINNTLSVVVNGTVRAFTPAPLSFIDIPGFANNVDVSGDYAYVAAGSAGLQIVDVSDRTHPRLAATRPLPGNANDVVLLDGYAYVAAGSAGLQIVNVTNPRAPEMAGSLNTGNTAWDVVVKNGRAYVANGAGGLTIVNVVNPAAPAAMGSINLSATAKGVDVDSIRQLAVVALGTDGLAVVNVANPAAPARLSTLAGGDVRDVAISGSFALLADFARSFTVADLTNPSAPVLGPSTPRETGGLLTDVTVLGNFAAGADVFFVNGVPFIDVTTPSSPQPRAILDFRNFRDDNGTGIALDANYVYVTAEPGLTENGVNGATRLYIGQYRGDDVTPPAVTITAPGTGTSVIEGTTLNVGVQATDNLAVASVNVLVDGQVVATTVSAPYQFSIPVPVGRPSINLTASAADFSGNTGVSPALAVSITRDTLQPTVQITSPPAVTVPEGASLHEVVEASDNVRVTRVEFLFNDAIYATKTAPPYEAFVTVPPGATSVRLGARAADPAGNIGSATDVVIAVLSDPPPSIRFISPEVGPFLTEGLEMMVSIEATDNGSIAFREVVIADQEGHVVLRDTTSRALFPFTVPFGVTRLTFSATARDNLGQTSNATPVIVTVLPDPAPTVQIGTPSDGATVLEGQTITLQISATDDREVSRIDVEFGDGATGPGVFTSFPPNAFHEVLLTAPVAPGTASTTITARSIDNFGKASDTARATIQVVSDPLTTLEGLVLDSSNNPAAGVQVSAALHGLSAEVFNSNSTLASLPDLRGPANFVKVVSTPNMPNLQALFPDPFGFGSSAGHTVRFAGQLRVDTAGSYSFSLLVNAGGRLTVNGRVLVDLPNATGTVQQGTGNITLPAGQIPIELLTFDNGVQQVLLAYQPPNQPMQVISPDRLTPARKVYTAVSDVNGRFSIAAVPTALGTVGVIAEQTAGGGDALRGASTPMPPQPGSITDVGTVTLDVARYDVSTILPGSFGFPGPAKGLQVSGRFAYVAAGDHGLQMIDLGDPKNPAPRMRYEFGGLSGPANDVAIERFPLSFSPSGERRLAYIATGAAGLTIVDVTNPLAPDVWAVAGGSDAQGVVVKRDALGSARAYVANGLAGLQIIDVSDPRAPVVLGNLPLPGLAKAVDVDPIRNIAVVALGQGGLAVVDITQPDNPQPVSLGFFWGSAEDIVLSGPFAYVAGDYLGLVVVDLSDATIPQVVSWQAWPGSYQSVAVDGVRAAPAGSSPGRYWSGLFQPIVDVSQPFATQARFLDFASGAQSPSGVIGTAVALDSGYVYLATFDGFSSELYIGQYLASDSLGVSPTVTIGALSRQPKEGQPLTAEIMAADDVAVATLDFYVNGQLIGTARPAARSAQQTFTFTVPVGATLSMYATATDLGGRTGTSGNVDLPVIPADTTVIGVVVDVNQQPVAGARVAVARGPSGITSANGAFSLPGVSSSQISITVNAVASSGAFSMKGSSSPLSPVRGGATNAGTIVLSSVKGGAAILVNQESATIVVLDLVNLTVRSSRLIGGGLWDAAVTPDGRTAVVTDTLNQRLYFVDLTVSPPALSQFVSLPLTGPIDVEIVCNPQCFALATGSGGLRSPWVYSVDIASRTVVSSIAMSMRLLNNTAPPDGLAPIPGGQVLAHSFNPSVLGSFTVSPSGTLTDTGVAVSLGNPTAGVYAGPLNAAVSPNASLALTANFGSSLSMSGITVYRIGADGALVPGSGHAVALQPPFRPQSVAFSPDGLHAYVLGDLGLSVAVLNIDTADNVTDSGLRIPVTAQGGPNRAGIDHIAVSGNRILVHSFNALTVIDATTNQVIGTIQIPNDTAGGGIAVIP